MDLQAFANLVFWSDISLTLYNTTIKSVHFPEALAEPFWLGPICENLQVRAELVQAISFLAKLDGPLGCAQRASILKAGEKLCI